jgi:hypothetical protein
MNGRDGGFLVSSVDSTGGQKMNRVAVLVLAISATSQTAIADEIRRVEFPSVLLGTWAETAEKCAVKDKSNISVEPAKYGDASGSCVVRWAVTTPGSRAKTTRCTRCVLARQIHTKLKWST